MKEQRSLMSWAFSHYCRQNCSDRHRKWCMVAVCFYTCDFEMNKVHLLLLVRSFTVRPVAAIHIVVRLRFSSSPCSFWSSVVSVDQAADLSLSRISQFWSICSLVWSSLHHRQAAHGTIFMHVCVQLGVCCSQSPQWASIHWRATMQLLLGSCRVLLDVAICCWSGVVELRAHLWGFSHDALLVLSPQQERWLS